MIRALYIYNSITKIRRFVSYLPEDYVFQEGDEIQEEEVTEEEYAVLMSAGLADSNSYNGLFPYVAEVIPNTYFTNTPTTVIITGGNFDRCTKVNIDGITQKTTFINPTKLVTTLVCDELGDTPIEVINTDLITKYSLTGVDTVIPSAIPDLVCWYDFTNKNTLTIEKEKVVAASTAGGPKNTAAQSSYSAQPSLELDAGGKGLNMLLLDGGDRLQCPLDVDAEESTIIVVLKAENKSRGTLYGIGYPSKSVGAFAYINRYAAGTLFTTYDGSSGNNSTTDTCHAKPYIDNKVHIYCSTFADGTTEMTVDGEDFTTYTENAITDIHFDELRIGALYSTGSTGYYGNIGEFILFNRKLTASELLTMDTYLKGKWRF